MTDSDGPYQALVLYKNELLRIADQLYAMEQEYQRNEEQTAATFDGGAV